MKIANIYTVANQGLYKDEEFVMILAHLVKAGYYKKENFNKSQHIIMDNGLYEKAQVSTKLQDCVDLAEQSGIPVKEIIIPDVVNDPNETIRLFEESIETIEKWQHKYQFMFVAQAKTYLELAEMFDYINRYAGQLNIVVGISKLSPLDRASYAAQALYMKSKFPIHFLGIKTTFTELRAVKDLIRSCDTSQLAYIAKNKKDLVSSVYEFARNGIDPDIDLEKDVCDEQLLKELKKTAEAEMKYNGIL